MEDLKLEQAWIAYPGDRRFPVHPKVEALPPAALMRTLARLD